MATSLPRSSESPALLSEAKSPEISPVAMKAAELENRRALSVSTNPNQILWVALTLTPRARHLVGFFGSVEGVFNASLTELDRWLAHASRAVNRYGPFHRTGT